MNEKWWKMNFMVLWWTSVLPRLSEHDKILLSKFSKFLLCEDFRFLISLIIMEFSFLSRVLYDTIKIILEHFWFNQSFLVYPPVNTFSEFLKLLRLSDSQTMNAFRISKFDFHEIFLTLVYLKNVRIWKFNFLWIFTTTVLSKFFKT